MSAILCAEKLTKKYKEHFALSEINMTINEGDIYGLVGENGAGKTTLIRLITNIANPTSGTIKIFGQSKVSDLQLGKVAGIVENPAVYLNKTAEDNLLLHSRILGINNPEQITEMLHLVGLGNVIGNMKKAKNFSLGMRQRLSLAMILLGSPAFIILDEPLNGLDPEGIVEMRELILKLNKERGITFLISSHLLGELAKVANRYGFIHHGKLIKEVYSADLNKELVKKVILEVSDGVRAETLINQKFSNVKFDRVSNMIKFYQDIDISEITLKLSEAQIKVLKINVEEPSIEDYYLNLIREKKHA